MIRIIIFLLAVGIVALGIAWLADRPGEVTVQWMGLQIETSVMVAAFAVLTTTALLLFLWTVLRSIMGLVKHRRGSIRVMGEEIVRMRAHRIGRGLAAMVPEGRRLFLDQSVAFNVTVSQMAPLTRGGLSCHVARP